MQQNKESNPFVFLARFNDFNLKSLLIDRDNIPPLEYLLDSEGQELQRLQKLEQEGKLDFGPKTSGRSLSSLSYSIEDEVNSFLDISEVDTPKTRYFSLLRPCRESAFILWSYSFGYLLLLQGFLGVAGGQLLYLLPAIAGYGLIKFGRGLHRYHSQTGYRPKTKSIILSKKEKRRVKLIPTIAHEYVHHIQAKKSGLALGNCIFFELFKEGHARGVERHISHLYREKEDNESFLYDITDETFGELKSAYLWICNHLGIQPRESLISKKSSRDRVESQFRAKLKEPTNHALGNTLFYLCETQQDSGIYGDIINGTFEFPNL